MQSVPLFRKQPPALGRRWNRKEPRNDAARAGLERAPPGGPRAMQERVPWEQLRAGDQEHTAPEASNYQRLLELGSAVWRAWVSAQLLLPSKVTAGQYDSRTPAAQGPRRTTGTVLSRPLLAFGGQSPRCQEDTLCQGLSSQRGHSVPPPAAWP